MKIVVTTRCLNGLEYIDRFVKGYSFADQIVVSDGGSDDGSIEKWLEYYPKVQVFQFKEFIMRKGYKWNPDNNHIQHAIDKALEFDPTWIILDDLDDVPNHLLRERARWLLDSTKESQVNAFRLYMWGDTEYFPKMNNWFTPEYKSLWAWKPKDLNITTDKSKEHGTLTGLVDNYYGVDLPACLLHKSWHPDTVQDKVDRYNAIGLPATHPLRYAGIPEPLPKWAHE